jgi:hypothetical protein
MLRFDLDKVGFWEKLEQPHSSDDIIMHLDGRWQVGRCLFAFLFGLSVRASGERYEVLQMSLYRWSAQAQLKSWDKRGEPFYYEWTAKQRV